MGNSELKDLSKRIGQLEDKNDLLRRSDPSIAFGIQLHELGEVPTCAIHNTNEQTINTAVWTELVFNTTTWDTGQMADLSNDRTVIQESGIYLVTCTVFFANNGTGGRGLRLMLGSLFFASTSYAATGDIPSGLGIAQPRHFDIGDAITAEVYQKSGGNLVTLGSGTGFNGPQLTATRISTSTQLRTEMA